MVNDKRLNNMHKVLYLIKEYPEKSIDEILGGSQQEPGMLPSWPSMDKNVAVWDAIEAGFIKDPAGRDHGDKFEVIEMPTNWEFGQAVEEMMETLLFACQQAAKKKTDFEEHFLGNWMAGYPPTDIFVMLKRLMETGKLVSYALEDMNADGDDVSTYLFYTLPEHKKALWGRNQFKKDPLGEK